MKNLSVPWFTEKDPVLSVTGTIRDPIGRLSIWRSGIGRELVPCLASSVTRLEGVIAVLFIYYVIELAEEMNKEWRFVRAFRLLEGLVEYYLATKKAGPIYGEQALQNKETFTISPNDVRTVCNGLRQYYRGSCRRAGLIKKDLTSLDKSVRKWCDEIMNHHLDSIQELIEELDSILENEEKTVPYTAKLTNRLHKIFDVFFENDQWADNLKVPLLGVKPEEQRFAELCSNIRLKNKPVKETIDEMMDITSDLILSEIPIRQVLPNIRKCEIFICWIYHVFYWLHRFNLKSFEFLSEELKSVENELINAAIDFLSIPKKLRTDRFEELAKVALSCTNDWNSLISKLLDYHSDVMEPRGIDPLLQEENGRLIVTEPLSGYYDLIEKGEEIKKGKWLDDYYTWAAGSIYKQLHEKTDS